MANLLVKSKEEILDIFKCMLQMVDLIEPINLEDLKKEIMGFKMMALSNTLRPTHFLKLGAATIRLIDSFRNEHDQPLFDPLKFSAFLWDKHRKYGAEPLIEVGTVGIIMRLIAKINRIINMQTLDDTAYFPDDEDTLMDILGYCVLGYQLMRTSNE